MAKQEKGGNLMQRVLIITYYWPPAGGPGVQRWLKFVKYLRDFNIEPVVYIPSNPHYPLKDESFVEEVPKGITVYQHKIFEPYRLAGLFSKKETKRISAGIIKNTDQSMIERLLLWVRGNFFIPDARKFWVRPSVQFLSKIISQERIDTIITTGPPHSIHLIGYGLKQKYKLQWVTDFRDPWTSIGYHKQLKLTKRAKKKHKELEKLVLKSADKIVVTSPTTLLEFKAITDRPIQLITNGYELQKKDKVRLDTQFTISHIGSLLTGRNPQNLWKVLAELIRENAAFKKALRLQLVGVVSEDVLATMYHHGLQAHTELMGYISHEEALSHQQKSQVLLLAEIDSKETKGIVPGKLFEYMAAGRPILAIGPDDWDAGQIINETNSGAVFPHSSHASLKKILIDWFVLYQKEELSVSSTNLEQYSRKALTKKLATYLRWE
ncbi:MAG: glycosyltransferase family 4 protein [Bacteroidota bacterium]